MLFALILSYSAKTSPVSPKATISPRFRSKMCIRDSYITSLPFILARNLATIPYYALRGQGRVILKSKLDALRGITKMMRKREHVLRRAEYSDIRRFVKTWGEMKRQ